MQTTYRFRLRPNQAQLVLLAQWQKSCCYVSNRMIGDREYTYQRQQTLGDYCSLHNKQIFTVSALRCDLEERFVGNGLHCSVNRSASLGYPWKTGDLKRARASLKSAKTEPSLRRSAYEVQSSFLPALKKLKPELAQVNSFVLQKQCEKVDKAFSRFFKKDESKYPSYKKPNQIGFEFDPKTVRVDWQSSRIILSGLGSVKFFNSRSWWGGLKVGRTSVKFLGGNWYINILVKDETIPDVTIIPHDQVKTVVGGDMGINKLLSLPGKTTYENPRFLKQEIRRLQIRQRRVSRKQKGSCNRKKAAKRVGKLHAAIARRREDYQWKVAKSFVEQADMNVLEDLKVSNMKKRCKPKQDENGKYLKNGQAAKGALNQAISDAAWYGLRQKIKHQSDKSGKQHIVVSPKHTSQECRKCHHVSKGNRDGEKFICEVCGHFDDADNNAGGNIADKGISQERLNPEKVRVVSPEFTPKILVRRYHRPLGLMSRGIAQSKARPEKRIPRKVISSDSHSVALAQDG